MSGGRDVLGVEGNMTPLDEREMEELDDIRAYDEAKASEEEFIPFELAVAEIGRARADSLGTGPEAPAY